MSTLLIIGDFPCPNCGYERLIYAENTANYHTVHGITFDGTILISEDFDRGDAYGEDARFFCPGCGTHFDASTLTYRFVDNREFEYADEPDDPFLTDAEADADVLRSAGMGTDEDYY